MAFLISRNYSFLYLSIYIYLLPFTFWQEVELMICCIYFPWESWEVQQRLHWPISSSHVPDTFLLMYVCWRRVQMGILLFKKTVLSWTLAHQAQEQLMFCVNPVEIMWERRFKSVLQIFSSYAIQKTNI